MRRRLVLSLALFLAAPVLNAQPLSLADYLTQVKTQGSDYQAQAAAVEGYEKQSHQQDLTYSPVLTAGYNHEDDQSLQSTFLAADKTLSDTAGVSITDTLPFGPKLSIGYAFSDINIAYSPQLLSSFGPFASDFLTSYYQISPVVSLSVPLFKDFGGAQTGAGVKKVQYQNESSAETAAYQREQELYNAKVAYWTLANDQEEISIRQDTLDRNQEIWDWTKKRVARNLAEPPDALEAQASVRVAELDLEKAQETERGDRIKFNRYRNVASDAVPETLGSLEDLLNGMNGEISKQAPERLDLQATEATAKQQKSAYDEAHQNVYPDLTANASWRGNGLDPAFDTANNQSFGVDHPTYDIGVSFNLPLDVFTASTVAEGYWQSYQSALLTLKDKQVQVQQDWQDLRDSLGEVDKRLDMTAQIEAIQKDKADQEKQRLEYGRTTEFQLLSYENDYNSSRLDHLAVILEKLNLLAKAEWWLAAENPDAAPGETK
jgi:outer membrane protein